LNVEQRKSSPNMLPLIICYLVITGVMTYFQKVAVLGQGWQTTLFWTWLTAFIINMAIVLPKTSFAINKFSILAILIGIGASATTFIFYFMMSKYDISSYVPIMTLYVVIPVVLSAIFLKDHLTITKVIGTALAITSVILINWERKP
jgi:drug/metabolite transporter (DMT)-like permease